MTRSALTLAAAATALAATAGIALASGGPPPGAPADPAANTVVATGSAQDDVVAPAPARRSDATIERAMRAARSRAMPAAAAAARDEARALAAAAGLRAGEVVGIRRDSSPPGWWDGDSGRFGPGRWCGRIYDGRRIVRQADGTTRRVARHHRGCPVPARATIRVTVTFAAQPR